MFKENSKQFKESTNQSKFDQVLWFIENYFPQKKDRGVQKIFYKDNLEAETIQEFSKLYSQISKTLFPPTKNKKISFTFGNWALPFVKFLNSIGIAK